MNPLCQLDSLFYQLLRAEDIEGSSRRRPADGWVDLVGGDFRDPDLRLLDAAYVDFSDVYFHGVDLRGVDLCEVHLGGASLAHAQISGTYSPLCLAPDEIYMPVNFDTRLRYLSGP